MSKLCSKESFFDLIKDDIDLKSFKNISYIEKVEEQIEKIESFKNLKENWDSYGAEKVNEDCIKRAISIVNFFKNRSLGINFSYPLPDGGIQLEMNNSYNLEIEVNPNGFNDQIIITDESGTILWEFEEPKLNAENLNKVISFYF